MNSLEKKPCNRFQFAADAAYALAAMEVPPDVADERDLLPEILAVQTIVPESSQVTRDDRHGRTPQDHRGLSRLITEPIVAPDEVASLWFEGARRGAPGETPPRTPANDPVVGVATTRRLAADTVDSVPPRGSGPDTESALRDITLAAAGESVESADRILDLPPIEVPPLPPTWRPATPAPRTMLLEGAGLGLFGIRTVPFVDRDRERDVLWEALTRVHQAHRPAAAVIQGSAGTGKSRLAEWIAERAHELGGARVLTARHGPQGSPAHGLPAMLARFTGCVGLSRAKTARRLERLLETLGVSDPYGWQALTEIMSPALLTTAGEEDDQVQKVRFRNPTERYTVIAGFLERLCRDRPVIVWLDDAQWGGDSLRFVYHAVKHLDHEGLAVLFLITAQDDALADRPYETSLLEQLKKLDQARALHVGPLAPEHHATLVRELLGLEPRLAARVESRTAGNPMFAVQLVGDWVQRRLLEPGEHGFVLKKGATLSLPDDIHQLWKTRIQRVLQGHPPTALHALELAATLGQSVLVDEWRDACREAGTPFPEGVLDNLLAHRLVSISLGKRSGQGPQHILWSFVHAMLRESLERSAREAGRSRRHHLACATMLLKRSPESTPGAYERIGRHYLAAGEIERALTPLLRAAERRREASDFHAARALVRRREEAIRALGGQGLDVRLGDGWLLEAQMDLDQERPEAVARRIAQLEEAARHGEWTRLRAAALRLKGDLARYHGDYLTAERCYETALPQLALREDARETAHCLRGLANVAWERGLADRTKELYEKALALYERVGDAFRTVSCLVFLGHVAQQTGKTRQAREHFQRAMALGRQHGHLSGVSDALRGLGRVALYDDRDPDKAIAYLRQAKTIIDRIGGKHAIVFFLNEAGEIARFQGDLDRAERAYRKAEEKARDTRAAGVWPVPTLNLATVLLIRGRLDEARKLLERAPERLERQGHYRVLGAFHAALVRCAADRGAWDIFDHHLTAAHRRFTTTGGAKEVDAWLIRTAAERCREQGQTHRADQAMRLCRLLLQQLGLDDESALDGTRTGHTL